MEKIITTKLTDITCVDLRHDKISRVATLDIDEITAEIKYHATVDIVGSTFEINFTIYNIQVEANCFDVDRQKWIVIREHLTNSCLLDWQVNKIELNDLSEINGIGHIEIDFIDKVVTFENL